MKILLFNPPGAVSVYDKSRIRAAVPRLPSLSLAMIAGALKEDGADVMIEDLSLCPPGAADDAVASAVKAFKPDFAGVTATTPLVYEAVRISDRVKEISRNICTVIGGPHASALPLETLRESSFDINVAGEGEWAIKKIIKGEKPGPDDGIYLRDAATAAGVPAAGGRGHSMTLDSLPFPALGLFKTEKYACPKVIARRNPVGPIEISRGCAFNCSFCNKTVHGNRFRIKSAGRVIEELRALKRLGYREFHVLDDQFTTDINRAKVICEEIIRACLDMPWNLRTGIRVDKVDGEFLALAKRAGCYQIGVGFESGSQKCLDEVGKGITVQQAYRAVREIRNAGIESAGFFILGFPHDTAETMEETINFAINLDPDYAKATILVPFPGTRLYEEYSRKGLIKTRDWARYNFHNANEIYTHPALGWETLNRYYDMFHRRFYLRPGYLNRRFWKAIKTGSLVDDIISGYATVCGRRQ